MCCHPVLELLDEPDLASGHDEIIAIRAIKYVYDFTSTYAPWSSKKIQGVSFHEKHWWTRSKRMQYVPEIYRQDSSLHSFLSYHGFLPLCLTAEERCTKLSPTGMRMCRVLNIFRSKNLIWVCILCIALLRLKKNKPNLLVSTG